MKTGEAEPLSVGHFSNIFCLSWAHTGEYLLSGGNDCQVVCHDMTSGQGSDIFTFQHPVHSSEFLCNSNKVWVV